MRCWYGRVSCALSDSPTGLSLGAVNRPAAPRLGSVSGLTRSSRRLQLHGDGKGHFPPKLPGCDRLYLFAFCGQCNRVMIANGSGRRWSGTFVRTRHKELGMTQKEPAERSGVSTVVLSDLESGKEAFIWGRLSTCSRCRAATFLWPRTDSDGR